MKRLLILVLCLCLLSGCGAVEKNPKAGPAADVPETTEFVPVPTQPLVGYEETEIPYESRFDAVTEVNVSDSGITVNGAGETDAVYTSHDIIYYEDKDAYDSGYPYGEGEVHERNSAEEAAAHTVVNITAPGAYRVSGKLSKGQLRIDLGETAYEDPNAVVELILSNADITCTVAPAVIFINVYECDGNWSADTAKSDVDTSAAGANLILEGENAVSGSHVARIYKDKEGEKKLWKQDGAIYSYMSMNVYGPGKLDLTADNEGLDTELHLTINGGDIAIRSQDDGINTNEDGVSVTAINGGNVHIMAGLGKEGDGIDSNGWLVINGGTVVSAANPGADAGLDSDMGSYINGGTVIALGSTMDWAESDSEQVTMNLQFAANQSSDAAVVVTRQDGTVIFAYDPTVDEVLSDHKRVYSGAVISCTNFYVGETYHVFVDGEVNGSDVGGVYDVTTVTGYSGGIQMCYTGTDVRMRPGGMMPGNFEPDDMPEDFDPGERPEGMEKDEPPQMPDGEKASIPEEWEPGQMPEDFEPDNMPEDFDPGQKPEGMERPDDGKGGFGGFEQEGVTGNSNAEFYMQDKVNFFSGLTNA